ncbi:type II toxin-antitoxin system death-on-curing family toxin [Cnuibacter sp. UC19_7]|uniref:type II toxin-antitoxin system death-on-curing family toxin n=1 Tax=Cnuibacter sp. UC19_7 TaxID=3350166 RepID=UPI00366E8B4B
MTDFLSFEQVLEIHNEIEPWPFVLGGEAKLAGAVGQPSQTWEGVWLYPTLLHQAAVLLVHVCQAHAWENANKRSAWMACTVFLQINGVQLTEVPTRSVVKLMTDVTNKRSNVADVVLWLADRT